MRQKNARVIVLGSVLIVLAIGFYLFMMAMAPKSNDPTVLMQTVGQVAGVVCGISVAMIIVGFIGKKV